MHLRNSCFQILISLFPLKISAGTRHILFDHHGHDIHEVMFVKLPKGMTAADYVAQVKAGELFPKGALDYSGAGLMSPGEGTELWLQLDAGEYVLICWHHPRVSVRSLSVQTSNEPDDTPPAADVTLADFRFELSGPVRKGQRVLRIETPGPSMNADLARKLAVLEGKYDRQFRAVFDAIRQLMAPPTTAGRSIGFTADIE
jgi:hypothetical protein